MRYSRSVANFFNSLPGWLVLFGIAGLIVAVTELGFRVGTSARVLAGGEGPAAAVQGATFTLVGLLLAFSFSLALQRYDSRRSVLVDETNAMGTTYLRTDLLSPQVANKMRDELRAYIADRLEFARQENDPPRQQLAAGESSKLQSAMWDLAMAEARRDSRSTQIPLFITTLNEMIDLSTEESAVLAAHIPDFVIMGLVLIMLIASAMMGFGFGRRRARAVVPTILLAITLTLSIWLVLDLDRPQQGFIRVNLDVMTALQQEMSR